MILCNINVICVLICLFCDVMSWHVMSCNWCSLLPYLLYSTLFCAYFSSPLVCWRLSSCVVPSIPMLCYTVLCCEVFVQCRPVSTCLAYPCVLPLPLLYFLLLPWVMSSFSSPYLISSPLISSHLMLCVIVSCGVLYRALLGFTSLHLHLSHTTRQKRLVW